MKFVMLSDTHLDHNKFWSDLVESLFDEIIDVCNEREITYILHLGDFFDTRKSLNVLALNKSIKICEKIGNSGKSLIILKGNHDQYYKTLPDPHSLEHLKFIGGTLIVDKITDFPDDHYLVPWGANISEIPDASRVFGHFEINGFVTNYTSNVINNANYNISDFKRFEKVYSGHFHRPSKVGNIEYIGSAFALNFNDLNATRGYYIFDTSTGECEFIEFKKAPKFLSFTSEEEVGDIRGNIVRFTFLKDYGNVKNEQIVNSLYEKNPLKLHVGYKINVDDEDDVILDDIEIENSSKVMLDYIDKQELPKHINKTRLKGIVKQLEMEGV